MPSFAAMTPLQRIHAHLAQLYAVPPRDEAEAVAIARRNFYPSALVEGLAPERAPGVIVEPASMGGVPGEWLRPPSLNLEGRLLYLHGGGWIAGSAAAYRHVTTRLAAESGVGTLAIDYRLAPEHPFPAALEDCLAAWRALVRLRITGPLWLAGDSAGGNLALLLAQTLLATGERLPNAIVTIGAGTDLTFSGASHTANAALDRNITRPALELMRRLYLAGGVVPEDPRVSPLFGRLEGLPPLLMHVGAEEVLLDDTLRFAERARAAGVSVKTKVWQGLPHVGAWWHHLLPEGRESLSEIGSFLRRHR